MFLHLLGEVACPVIMIDFLLTTKRNLFYLNIDAMALFMCFGRSFF